METYTLNIRMENSKGEASGLKPVSSYYYNIQGIGIMLYEADDGVHGPFATAEYFTGRHLRSGDTMQEALDKVTAIINEKGFEAFQNKIKERLAESGYANTLECIWCGEQHLGGPEHCKGAHDG